jgi:c-di-GMP-binding flagellar brake protein YcgR
MTGFDIKQHVSLVVPALGEGRPLSARVEDVTEDSITLGLFAAPAWPDGGVEGAAAHIEFTSPRGVHQLEGAVDAVAGDLVRLAVTEQRLVQRRDDVRVEAMVPVAVRRPEQGASRLATYTLDVSGGGFLIAGPDTLAVGERVQLALKLPDDPEPPLDVLVTVVRETGDGLRGVTIDAISPHDERRLVRFVFDRQRFARRMIREGS